MDLVQYTMYISYCLFPSKYGEFRKDLQSSPNLLQARKDIHNYKVTAFKCQLCCQISEHHWHVSQCMFLTGMFMLFRIKYASFIDLASKCW